MLPAVGQGALAVEVRAGEAEAPALAALALIGPRHVLRKPVGDGLANRLGSRGVGLPLHGAAPLHHEA